MHADMVSRRRARIALLIWGVVILALIGGWTFVWLSWEGGPQSVWLNAQPAPDQDNPKVVQLRQEARAQTRANLLPLDQSGILTPGPQTYSAYCKRGQNNWKVREGYVHTCSVTSGRFYAWDGDFPAMAQALHEELEKGYWSPEGAFGLPELAKGYDTGRPPYLSASPQASPTPVDFHEPGWDTTYQRGAERILFAFADRRTGKLDSFDVSQSRLIPWDTSWTDTSQTTDSSTVIRDLLAQHDGVIFAFSEQQYYEVRR